MMTQQLPETEENTSVNQEPTKANEQAKKEETTVITEKAEAEVETQVDPETESSNDSESPSEEANITTDVKEEEAPVVEEVEVVNPFAALGLPTHLCEAVAKINYETPSPIQSKAIEPMLKGRDILGLAQTGTGKTAAFALPILANIDVKSNHTQALILAPTRELALQVSEAFESFSNHMRGFRVTPIYGGQEMRNQLRALRRGAQVVVGTPGRIMDHMRRGTLDVSRLSTFVLDEADEMLRVGFLEDVEWILQHLPEKRQMALFSATMPSAISRITGEYLNNPIEIRTKTKTKTVDSTEQTYVMVQGHRKIEALARILEIEDYDGVIVFVRTKNSTVELAQQLETRGFSCAAINGDLNQKQREFTINSLRKGTINILVATDVASRGIDVPRISMVVNYDIPFNAEAYVHRIGRTGRAGRSGKALLLVTPRERRMLRTIERSTRQPIKEVKVPTHIELGKKRELNFQRELVSVCKEKDLTAIKKLIDTIQAESELTIEELASGLAWMVQSEKPLTVRKDNVLDVPASARREERPRRTRQDREAMREGVDMDIYRLEVGHNTGVGVRDILGAVANELSLDSHYIGSIRLDQECSYVELPSGMPSEVRAKFRNVRIRGTKCNASLASGEVDMNKRTSSGRSGGGYKGGSRSRNSNRSRDDRRGDFKRRGSKNDRRSNKGQKRY